MLKELIKKESEAETLRQCKWQNLLFDKNGKSYRGKNLWETKQRAIEQINTIRRQIAEFSAQGTPCETQTLDGPLDGYAFSWALQIPVMEGG